MSEELLQANLITYEMKEKDISDTEQSGTLIIKNCQISQYFTADKVRQTENKDETRTTHSKDKSKITTRCQTGNIKMHLFHYTIMQHYR